MIELSDGIEVITTNRNIHNSLLIHINANLNLKDGIKVKFTSASRDDVEYYIEDEITQEIFGERVTFSKDKLVNQAWENVKFILLKRISMENGDSPDDRLLDLIHKAFIVRASMCYAKCETRYGYHVEDYDLTDYDACLVLN